MQTVLDRFFRPISCNRDRGATASCNKDPRPFTFKRSREDEDNLASRNVLHRCGAPVNNHSSAESPLSAVLPAIGRQLTSGQGSVGRRWVADDCYRFFLNNASSQSLQFNHQLLGTQNTVTRMGDALHFDKCLVDFVFDSRYEYSIARQRSLLSLVDVTSTFMPTSSTHEGVTGDDDAIVSLSTHAIQRHHGIEASVRLRFTTAEFLGESLNILTSLSRGGYADVFDLEVVDEDVCEPLHSFDVRQTKRFGPSSSTVFDGQVPQLTDIAVFSNDIALASLSSGESVWLDKRQATPILCSSSNSVVSCTLARNIAARTGRTGPSPLTSVAFTSGGYHFVTGSKSGALVLWDSRFSRTSVSTFQNTSEICHIDVYQPSFTNEGQSIWANDYTGNIMAFSCGPDGLKNIAKAKTRTNTRSEDDVTLPTPKISIVQTAGILVYPHHATNTVLGFDVSYVRRNAANRDRFSSAGVEDYCTVADEPLLDTHSTVTPPPAKPYLGFQNALTILDQERRAANPYQIKDTRSSEPVTTLIPSFLLMGEEDNDTVISCCSAVEKEAGLLIGGSNGKSSVVVNDPAYYERE